MPIPSDRVLETVGKDTKTPKQVRISRKVRDAVELMISQARKRADAAQQAGLTDDALYRALKKPEVQALMRERLADLRKSEAARSIARMADIADTGRSEAAKVEANKWLAGIEGVRPAERVQHDHTHRIVPGYVIDLGGPDLERPAHLQGDGPVIDGEGREIEQGKRSPQGVQDDDSADDAPAQDVGAGGPIDDRS